MTYKIITAEMLVDLDACAWALNWFKQQWPEGAKCTLANCMIVANKDVDMIDWAVELLISAADYNTFLTLIKNAESAWFTAETSEEEEKMYAAFIKCSARAFHKLAKGVLR